MEIIHGHMAGSATVEPSAFLRSRTTGATREVDVVVRSMSAGHEVVVSIEAVSRSRKATREWVDQMLGKHADLPTNKLVLISERGFTRDAREAAVAAGAVPLAPENVATNAAEQIVLAVPSLWPKLVIFTPKTFSVEFDTEIPAAGWHSGVPAVYVEDGTLIAPSLGGFVQELQQRRWQSLTDEIGLAKIAKSEVRSSTFVLEEIRPKINGARQVVCLRNADDRRLYRLKRIAVNGTLEIQVSNIALTHKRLGDVDYAFGHGKLGDREALVVATAHDELLTLRFRPELPVPITPLAAHTRTEPPES